MKKILIIKTGSTVQPLLELGEDFENWIIAGSGLDAGLFNVVSVFKAEAIPSLNEISGIIVTGSPANITDHLPWNESSASFIRQAVQEKIPVLGICYGHQLLAYSMGGKVDYHPQGREIGTVAIELNDAAVSDPLLRGMPANFYVQESHQQSVIELPSDAVLLAHNEFDPHQAFRIGDSAWGVQFHPEFSAQTIRAYIRDRRVAIEAEGFDYAHLLNEVRTTPASASLLEKFASIVTSHASSSSGLQDSALLS